MKETATMLRYGRGYFGGGYFGGGMQELDVCPTITICAWEHNNLIVEYEDEGTNRPSIPEESRKTL